LSVKIHENYIARIRQLNWGLLLIVVSIYSLSFYLRLEDIFGVRVVVYDEALYASAGIAYVSDLLRLSLSWHTFSINFEHPDLAKLIFGLFVKLLSPIDFSKFPCLGNCTTDHFAPFDQVLRARLGAATISSLGPVLLFFFLKDLTRNALTGIAAAFFLAANPLYTFWSSMVFLDGIAATFTIGAVCFFYLAQKRKMVRYYFLAGFFGGLSTASKYVGVLSFAVMFASVFLSVPRVTREALRRSLAPLLSVTLAALFAFCLGDPVVLIRPGVLLDSVEFHLGRGRFLGFDAKLLLGYLANPSQSVYFQWIWTQTSPIAFVGFVVGLVYVGFLALRGRKEAVLSGAVILIPYFFLTFGYLETLFGKFDYYFTIVPPSIAALAGVGCFAVSRYAARVISSLAGVWKKTIAISSGTDAALLTMLYVLFFSVQTVIVGTLVVAAYMIAYQRPLLGRLSQILRHTSAWLRAEYCAKSMRPIPIQVSPAPSFERFRLQGDIVPPQS
jgi:hypothetical protein